LKTAHYLGYVAAVEEFALQNFPQTRAKSVRIMAAVCTARLAPNFHLKHVQPPPAESYDSLFCVKSVLLVNFV
jgi:hypothetical protein